MPTLSDWNWYTLMLGQALLGVISSNFRMITLKFAEDCWIVEARFYTEDQQDRDEFNEAIDEFSIFVEDVKHQISRGSYKKIAGKIVVGEHTIEDINTENTRVIFRMREV